jgi:hypothetical protein
MTDPSDVAAAMAAAHSAEDQREAAGLGAVRGGPPATADQGPMFPPLLVHEIGTTAPVPYDQAPEVD